MPSKCPHLGDIHRVDPSTHEQLCDTHKVDASQPANDWAAGAQIGQTN